jgi:DNA-binding MarR family transcriptional regulator
MSATTLNPQILGQAERAHRALLDRLLTGTGLTYHHWVALALLGGGRPDADGLVSALAGGLKIDTAAAEGVVAELADAGLIETANSVVELTGEGRETYGRLRAAVDETIGSLYAGIPADELATAGRVVALVTTRANAELMRETV